MKNGFRTSFDGRVAVRRAARGLGVGVALVVAQLGLTGTAQAADLKYDVSLSGVSLFGPPDSINATLDLTGVTQAPTGANVYLYDTNANWTITINSGIGAFSGYAGLVLTDYNSNSYLNFNAGVVTGHFFQAFYSTGFAQGYYDDGGQDVFYGSSQVSGRASLAPVGVTAAVPEPATWAMMIGGFGLVGASMRRRRSVAVGSARA